MRSRPVLSPTVDIRRMLMWTYTDIYIRLQKLYKQRLQRKKMCKFTTGFERENSRLPMVFAEGIGRPAGSDYMVSVHPSHSHSRGCPLKSGNGKTDR